MDRVRFGRALGFGARQAVKALATAVDAAAADNPSAVKAAPRAPRPAPGTPPAGAEPVRKAAAAAAKTAGQARQIKTGVARGSRRFGEAVWRPFVRLSGVLWLEVSGVFFGVFALLAFGWGWKVRGAWRLTADNAADHRRLLSALAMLALFGYFCISSFVRARRRERGR
jgi:hypothetical protein